MGTVVEAAKSLAHPSQLKQMVKESALLVFPSSAFAPVISTDGEARAKLEWEHSRFREDRRKLQVSQRRQSINALMAGTP
jgi:hypothetical protein